MAICSSLSHFLSGALMHLPIHSSYGGILSDVNQPSWGLSTSEYRKIAPVVFDM